MPPSPPPADAKVIQQLCTTLFHEFHGQLGFSDEWFGQEGWLLFCNGFLALHKKLGFQKAYARYRVKAARLLLDQCRLMDAKGEIDEDYADDPGYIRALGVIDGIE